MHRLEKIMLTLMIAIIAVNVAIVALKIAKLDEKVGRIIEFENLNEVLAD